MVADRHTGTNMQTSTGDALPKKMSTLMILKLQNREF